MCNCGGGRKSTPMSFRRTFRPSVGPASISGGTAAGPDPGTTRMLAMQAAISPTEYGKMDEQRRRIEKLRRAAVKRKLGH